MFNFEDNNEDILKETKKTLQQIKDQKESNKSILVEMKENNIKFDTGKFFFQEYDSVVYEGKIKVDMLYYDQLLQKMDDTVSEGVQNAIISLYKTINSIYEFVNISPEIYGNSIDVSILESSIENTHRKLSKVIFEFLDNNFYRLTAEQRKVKYFEEHKELAKSLISEGNSPDDSISFSVKSIITENLLRHLSFPFGSWSRINYLIENDDYGAIFDQEKLIVLVDEFNKKLRSISKIVATCI